MQPAWSAQNILHFSSDRSGWWNLYAREGGRELPLCPIEAEIGGPHWVFRQRYYAFLKDGRIVACFRQGWRAARGADRGRQADAARHRPGRRMRRSRSATASPISRRRRPRPPRSRSSPRSPARPSSSGRRRPPSCRRRPFRSASRSNSQLCTGRDTHSGMRRRTAISRGRRTPCRRWSCSRTAARPA